MKEMTANPISEHPRLNKLLVPAAILAIVILAGFFSYRARQKPGPAVVPPEMTTISQSALEEQYGLHVNLVAVTAAGGLVDVRLKIIDGEKAKSLLEDSNNFPALRISEGEVILTVPEENRSQEIKFEDNGNLFVMFPNAGGLVKPGTPVSLRFGTIQVEPIPAK